jgi:hypothetical protein
MRGVEEHLEVAKDDSDESEDDREERKDNMLDEEDSDNVSININYKINSPQIIANCQHEMGWVDRHNRYRQGILGLHKIWKTKLAGLNT